MVEINAIVEPLTQRLHAAILRKDADASTIVFEQLLDLYPQVRNHESLHAHYEHPLGRAICAACDHGLPVAGDCVTWFMQHFPRSNSPVRVALAGMLEERGQDDAATFHARDWLHDLYRMDTLGLSGEFMEHQKGRAFCLVTSAYSKRLGAHSYSLNVFRVAQNYPIHEQWKQVMAEETQRLRRELQEPAAQRLDRAWVEFFTSGANARELMDWCDTQKCPRVTDRVELIEGNFRLKEGYRVLKSEVFEQVFYGTVPGSDRPMKVLLSKGDWEAGRPQKLGLAR
jgi:hypothetical protein